ncbi:MAG: hypothetical protein AAF653_12830 [Chloroflexota bacterium]
MATPAEVRKALKKFSTKIDRANKEIEDVLQTVRELEKVLDTYNADEDLNITRGIKADIRQGKKKVDDLRNNVNKLQKELSDTKRKYHYLAT